ncbi:cobyrinate a,c-diamide synthase [Methylocaldum szegediense]|uniref:Cobyrinate a,c-diamide synthase n=1 Tax=Methylocaldum szegediense TaxID=73780 RepID=A0ABM9HZM8_9GAMM|nr:cobyrinate a,c-diamide synthase [Methylocaldum szegediense]CAI8792538.1 Hydrogenobyrinate a,c-diamide synthase [Methylocaldum szegediense]
MNHCPALLIAAPASGQGKTTVTAGLARLHARRGRRVRVFKTGPDFLDPMVLEKASGAPVYNLDLWMGGESHCRRLLHAAAGEADLILVEGVMGLYDGEPSSADLAVLYGIPVLAVVDASAMAQTFAAVAHGLATFRDELRFFGVLANRVGSAGHAEMLRTALPDRGIWRGALPREADFELPERHLGLYPAEEIADLDARIEAVADALERTPLAESPPPVDFPSIGLEETATLPLSGVTIAVARDSAFCFLYRANLDTLRALGAELVFFSPLADKGLPQADAVWLPGGYPELHLDQLAANHALKDALRRHQAAGKPILAECGGFLYLLETLADTRGHHAEMVGLLPGRAVVQARLANLGLQSVELPEGRLRGHTFHHARAETHLAPVTHTCTEKSSGRPEAVYRDRRLLASFLHLYFSSNPAATAALFAP